MRKALKDLEIQEIKTGVDIYDNSYQAVLIGAIGDQSCFYHCICKSICKKYQELGREGKDQNNIYSLRQNFVDNFRKEISEWLVKPSNINNHNEACLKINISIPRLNILFRTQVRDPNNIDVGSYSLKNSWFHRILLNLSGKSERRMEKTLKWLVQNCCNRNKKYKPPISTVPQRARLTRSEIKKLKLKEGLANLKRNLAESFPNSDEQEIQTYFNIVEDSFNLDCSISEILSKFDKSIHVLIKPYIIGCLKLCHKLRDLIGNPKNIEWGSYSEERIRGYINLIKNRGVKALMDILLVSINKNTNSMWTREDLHSYLYEDPRKNCLEYPININYFMMGDGIIIERMNLPNDNGINSFHLNELIKTISPEEKDNSVIFRCDSGEDDIISIIPYILNISIIIVENMKIKSIYSPSVIHSNYPIVIFNYTGNHFEVIGEVNKNSIKTIFSYKDPLVITLTSNQNW